MCFLSMEMMPPDWLAGSFPHSIPSTAALADSRRGLSSGLDPCSRRVEPQPCRNERKHLCGIVTPPTTSLLCGGQLQIWATAFPDSPGQARGIIFLWSWLTSPCIVKKQLYFGGPWWMLYQTHWWGSSRGTSTQRSLGWMAHNVNNCKNKKEPN